MIDHGSLFSGNILYFFGLPARQCDVRAGLLVEVTGAARTGRMELVQRDATTGGLVRRAPRATTSSREVRYCRL
jgi:hypothetical protein